MNYSKYALAVIGTSLTWLFGSWDIAIKVLIIFMIADYATGLLKPYVNKEASLYILFLFYNNFYITICKPGKF